MFEIGENIVYGVKGVCRIEDITHIDISGADKNRLYYVLVPLGDASGKIYAPIDSEKMTIRKVISKDEADQLITELPEIELLWVPDDRQREAKYKEALRTCDYRAWVSIVKTLYERKRERIEQGKKITALDEKYMKAAEDELYSELSLSLGVSKQEMEDYIKEKIKVVNQQKITLIEVLEQKNGSYRICGNSRSYVKIKWWY